MYKKRINNVLKFSLKFTVVYFKLMDDKGIIIYKFNNSFAV